MPSSVATADGRPIEDNVLDVVGGLVAELGTSPPGGTVSLRHSLDRDLGLGSLERVELTLRLERAFGVRLGDEALARADTVRDLVHALLASAPATTLAPPPEPAPVVGAGAAAPASARTLTDVLRWHAEADPERVHVFLVLDDGRERPITYGALWREAARIAGALAERGVVAGESVALMLRTEEAFFPAFFGILLAGGVPVPIYPPFRLDRIEDYARRQVGILRNAEARLLVTFREAEVVARLLRARVGSLREVVGVERLRGDGEALAIPRLHPDDPALIQYTSGSTGDPKGVLLSHANILANIGALGQALELRPGDVSVSWLPLYHDMGLIGMWLGSLYHAIPAVIFPPLAFLSRPARWLRAIHAHRATLSAAPNFAFDLCVRKIADDEIEGLDLGCWRLAMNGSEPVSPDTIERFTRRFVPCGFRPEAMCPVYGLAEASVGLTCSPPGRGPSVDRVAREVFERSRRAAPAPAGPRAAPADEAARAGEAAPLSFVSCGRPLPGHEVRIVDAAGAAAGERVEGRVEFRGPSVTSGYFKNPEATRAVLRDGWMDSGDLGYQAGGEVFVTGRRKDLIIKAGRNLYPQEVEEVAGDVPGIRKGCVAAFGLADPGIGTERLVVVAESRERAPERRERLRAAVVDRVVQAIGIPPDLVVIAAPGAVSKTSSGKIRRSATREAFLGGALGRRRPSAARQWARVIATDLGARLRGAGASAARLAFAARVGLVLVVALPILAALLRVAPARATDRVVRRWCRTVLALVGVGLVVEGGERLVATGGAVLVANHASYLDAMALLAAIPAPFRFVAKRELARAPLVGAVIERAGHLTVDRTDLSRSVADAGRVSAALAHGDSVLVFPEGTFVRAPGLLPFRLGAFKAAVEAGRPVFPIALRGTRSILPEGTWLPRRGTVTVTIGEALVPEPGGWREVVRLRDLAREAIGRASGEPV